MDLYNKIISHFLDSSEEDPSLYGVLQEIISGNSTDIDYGFELFFPPENICSLGIVSL